MQRQRTDLVRLQVFEQILALLTGMAEGNAGLWAFRCEQSDYSLQPLAGGDFVEALGDRVLGLGLFNTDSLWRLQESPR